MGLSIGPFHIGGGGAERGGSSAAERAQRRQSAMNMGKPVVPEIVDPLANKRAYDVATWGGTIEELDRSRTPDFPDPEARRAYVDSVFAQKEELASQSGAVDPDAFRPKQG